MYDDLVKQCRDCIDCLCGECKYEHLQKPGNFVVCMNALLGEVDDAIEELQKLNCELLFRVGQAEALIDYYQTGRMISNEPPKEEV